MKVIDGKIIRVVQTFSFKNVKEYLKDNPEYEIIDTETWGDNIFARENWYYLIHQDYYKNDYVTMDLTERCVVLFDPGYTKIRIRLPDEPVVVPYLDWAMEMCEKFLKEEVPFVYFPQVAGEIKIRHPGWIQERQGIVHMLRELCKEFGDTNWQDDDHLGDVIEKHLAKYLWKRK